VPNAWISSTEQDFIHIFMVRQSSSLRKASIAGYNVRVVPCSVHVSG